MPDSFKKQRFPFGIFLLVVLTSTLMLGFAGMFAGGGLWLGAQPSDQAWNMAFLLSLRSIFYAALVWVLCFVVILFCFIVLLFRSDTRKYAFIALIPLGIGFASVVLFSLLIDVEKTRTQAVAQIASNAVPLIQALENYKQDKGKYPPMLEVLLVEYLEDLPKPGIVGASHFNYELEGGECRLFVRFFEDELFFTSDKEKRRALAEHPLYSTQDHGWLFLNT